MMHHLIVWHLPVDGRIAYAWEKHYGQFMVYPMTYHALSSARDVFGLQKVVDPLALLNSEARCALYQQAIKQTDAFHLGENAHRLGYLSCIDGEELCNIFYLYHYFQTFLKEVRKRYGDGPVIQYGFFSGLVVSGLLIRIQELVQLVIDEVGDTHGMGLRRTTQMHLCRIYECLLGRILANTNCYIRPRIRNKKKLLVDLLFVALEESDRRIQSPLIDRLLDRSTNLSVRWITVAGDRMAVSSDENRREQELNELPGVDAVEQDITRQYVWSIRLFRTLYGIVMRCHVHKLLGKIPGFDLTGDRGVWSLAGYLAKRLERNPISCHAVRGLLDCYRPRYLVTNSSFGIMRVVQAYAELKGINVIRFPHGVEDVYGAEVMISRGDLVARFGELEVDMLRRARPVRRDSFRVCGGLHLAEMALRDSGKFNKLWPDGRVNILHPLNYWLINFPDAPSEVERDLTDLSSAGARVGARVAVRSHPRQKEWNYFDYELMNKTMEGHSWVLSDGSGSLVDEMAASHIIVLRSWGGASLQALYSRRPIVAWMPRKGLDFSDEILGLFPCKAKSENELTELFRKLIDDAGYREMVVARQDDILSYVVSHPYGDPYNQAEALVVETIHKAKPATQDEMASPSSID